MNAVQRYYNLTKKHITPVGLKPIIKQTTKVIRPSPLSPAYRPHKFNAAKVNPGNFNANAEMEFWKKYFSKGGRSVTRKKQKRKQTRGYRRRV
jgi:hypothetical protein